MACRKPYHYEAFSSQHSIRLLILEPRSSLGAPLQCRLIEVDLGNLPPYEAVSYTWGSPTSDRPISCGSQRLYVTENCEAVLQHIAGRCGRTVWIDSVCINQGSVTERNTQVQIMGEIYSKAAKVIVWLGCGSPETDLALKNLTDYSKILDNPPCPHREALLRRIRCQIDGNYGQ